MIFVLHSVIHDFRSQGIQVAFSCVGERLERSLRNFGLLEYLGEDWLFHSVHESVMHCVCQDGDPLALATLQQEREEALRELEHAEQRCLQLQLIDRGGSCAATQGFPSPAWTRRVEEQMARLVWIRLCSLKMKAGETLTSRNPRALDVSTQQDARSTSKPKAKGASDKVGKKSKAGDRGDIILITAETLLKLSKYFLIRSM
ncbi:hypothetical protein AK812_SmicGene2775 [Symbiodinium microadriaticum]|uniref:STAS domain-containing protein n=1 Tax=Symbiodinium microadriaticum TaxID=2951 RepID=A0A1Q9F0R5_SYMMI|nr:hypothetical protein AK812_SmicGene2775 [Symbiodinium microadriaticum]